mgnify:CR=1 FL=1|jgi:hypothetical protein
MVDGSALKLRDFKKKVPEIRWIIDFDIFETLKQQIKSLGLVTNDYSIDLNCDFIDLKKYEPKKINTKLEKVKSGNISGFRTPKNQ